MVKICTFFSRKSRRCQKPEKKHGRPMTEGLINVLHSVYIFAYSLLVEPFFVLEFCDFFLFSK